MIRNKKNKGTFGKLCPREAIDKPEVLKGLQVKIATPEDLTVDLEELTFT
jgi:hypothetical protein